MNDFQIAVRILGVVAAITLIVSMIVTDRIRARRARIAAEKRRNQMDPDLAALLRALPPASGPRESTK